MFKWLFGDKKDSSGVKEANDFGKVLVSDFLEMVREEISEIRKLVDATLYYSSFHIRGVRGEGLCIYYGDNVYQDMIYNDSRIDKDLCGKILNTIKNETPRCAIGCLISPSVWVTDGEKYYIKHPYKGVSYVEAIDCKTLDSTCEDIVPIDTVFTECEDPRKTYWKKFLHKKMLLKQQRDNEMKSYVDSVLKKHQEYNDLQLKYETIMASPITCVESFRNFCKIVHEECVYEDYEIQNYLTLKGVNKL